MAELTQAEVMARLRGWSESPESLIGIHENQEVEFKTTYRLETPAEKLEYAKDLSAMYNGGGGVIVVGVQTERDPVFGRDVSVSVRPLPPGLIVAATLESIARSWIFPPLRNVVTREWPGNDQKLLISITVAGPSDEHSLAVVQGAEVEDRVDKRLFTIARRFDSGVDTYTAAEVYEWIRRGRAEGILSNSGRSQAIPAGAVVVNNLEAQQQYERAREILGDSEWPTFVLEAWTEPPERFTGLHDVNGVRGLLQRPPALRELGFNLRWWGASEPELEEDSGLRFPGGRRGTLWLTSRGVMTLAATAGPDLLGWGIERRYVPPVLNPLVLVELTFEFVRVYFEGVSKFFEQTPEAMFARIALVNALGPEPTKLLRGPVDAVTGEVGVTADSEIRETLGPFSPATDPATVTAQLVRRFYDHFGIGVEGVPYLTDDGAAVDVDKVRNA